MYLDYAYISLQVQTADKEEFRRDKWY